MAQPVTLERLFQEFGREGVFGALVNFVEAGDMSPQQAADMQAKAFNVFALNVKEAQTEMHRIAAVLSRLEVICAAGKQQRPWHMPDPRILQLAHEITTLDGWVMSLYETLLTMIAFGNPQRGKAKAYEMARSFEAQWAKKLEKMDMGFKDPTLFTRG